MNWAWRPIAVGLAGAILLLVFTPRVHPTARWNFTFGREEAIAKARSVAQTLGIQAETWKPYVIEDRQGKLEYYRQLYPDDPAAQPIAAEQAQVTLASPDHKRAISVSFFPNGRIAGWDRKQEGSSDWNMSSMRSSVDAAFHTIAGSEAGAYRQVTEGASTKTGLRFTWERPSAMAFHPTIDVIARNGAVVHAETHYEFSSDFDQTNARRRTSGAWLALCYFALYFAMVLGAAVLYTLGSIRRRVDQRFALTVSLVNIVFVALAFWFGPQPETFGARAAMGDNSGGFVYTGFLFQLAFSFLLGVVITGAGLFVAGSGRHKWLSLRLLLSRHAGSRQVGRSLFAGAMWAPLLAAVPFVTAVTFPAASWDIGDHFEFFAPGPVLHTLWYPLHPSDLGFFGIIFGFAIVRISQPWLRLAILGMAALFFFNGLDALIEGSSAGIMTNGALLSIVLIQLYRRFDLLAVLAAESCKWFLTIAPGALLQPSGAIQGIGWRLLALFGTVLGAGLILLWKAPEYTAEDDAQSEPLGVKSDREELQSEFLIAQRAQREMLPANPPLVRGFSLAASCTPAKEVGGDLYDFVRLSDERLAIAVADVSGKGVPAALYMTLTKGLLAATAQDDLELRSMLDTINGHLYTVGKRKTFVTMALGILDPRERTLEYARAGHNPVVWHQSSSGKTSMLTSRGLGLGITPSKVFSRTITVEKIALESGDMLVFYSDGLTEAMNAQLEQFGEDRLIDIVDRMNHLPADSAHDAILSEVTAFLDGTHPQDDLTLVVLRVD